MWCLQDQVPYIAFLVPGKGKTSALSLYLCTVGETFLRFFFLFSSCLLLINFSDPIVDSKNISAENGHLGLCSQGAAIEFTRSSKNFVLQALS